MIRKRGSVWVVLDSAGKKVLGKHTTREDAVKQLQAIEASKQRREEGVEKARRRQESNPDQGSLLDLLGGPPAAPPVPKPAIVGPRKVVPAPPVAAPLPSWADKPKAPILEQLAATTNIMGHAVTLASVHEDDGIRTELFQETTDGGGAIRTTDMDSGQGVGLVRYPTMAAAKAAFAKFGAESKKPESAPKRKDDLAARIGAVSWGSSYRTQERLQSTLSGAKSAADLDDVEKELGIWEAEGKKGDAKAEAKAEIQAAIKDLSAGTKSAADVRGLVRRHLDGGRIYLDAATAFGEEVNRAEASMPTPAVAPEPYRPKTLEELGAKAYSDLTLHEYMGSDIEQRSKRGFFADVDGYHMYLAEAKRRGVAIPDRVKNQPGLEYIFGAPPAPGTASASLRRDLKRMGVRLPESAPKPATSPTPPPGFAPIPGSKRGGYHKREGKGYVYWYPETGAASAEGPPMGVPPEPVPPSAKQQILDTLKDIDPIWVQAAMMAVRDDLSSWSRDRIVRYARGEDQPEVAGDAALVDATKRAKEWIEREKARPRDKKVPKITSKAVNDGLKASGWRADSGNYSYMRRDASLYGGALSFVEWKHTGTKRITVEVTWYTSNPGHRWESNEFPTVKEAVAHGNDYRHEAVKAFEADSGEVEKPKQQETPPSGPPAPPPSPPPPSLPPPTSVPLLQQEKVIEALVPRGDGPSAARQIAHLQGKAASLRQSAKLPDHAREPSGKALQEMAGMYEALGQSQKLAEQGKGVDAIKLTLQAGVALRGARKDLENPRSGYWGGKQEALRELALLSQAVVGQATINANMVELFKLGKLVQKSQGALFGGGAPHPGLVLEPSKDDPSIRRWQKPEHGGQASMFGGPAPEVAPHAPSSAVDPKEAFVVRYRERRTAEKRRLAQTAASVPNQVTLAGERVTSAQISAARKRVAEIEAEERKEARAAAVKEQAEAQTAQQAQGGLFSGGTTPTPDSSYPATEHWHAALQSVEAPLKALARELSGIAGKDASVVWEPHTGKHQRLRLQIGGVSVHIRPAPSKRAEIQVIPEKGNMDAARAVRDSMIMPAALADANPRTVLAGIMGMAPRLRDLARSLKGGGGRGGGGKKKRQTSTEQGLMLSADPIQELGRALAGIAPFDELAKGRKRRENPWPPGGKGWESIPKPRGGKRGMRRRKSGPGSAYEYAYEPAWHKDIVSAKPGQQKQLPLDLTAGTRHKGTPSPKRGQLSLDDLFGLTDAAREKLRAGPLRVAQARPRMGGGEKVRQLGIDLESPLAPAPLPAVEIAAPVVEAIPTKPKRIVVPRKRKPRAPKVPPASPAEEIAQVAVQAEAIPPAATLLPVDEIMLPSGQAIEAPKLPIVLDPLPPESLVPQVDEEHPIYVPTPEQVEAAIEHVLEIPPLPPAVDEDKLAAAIVKLAEPAPERAPDPPPESVAPAGIDYSQPFSEVLKQILPYGAQKGWGPDTRKKRNAGALQLSKQLIEQPRAVTDADKATLRGYSGRGGIGGSINEFYTNSGLVAAMWHALLKLGKFETVLEPSCGPGAFIGHAPAGVKITAVELETATATIAGQVHPEAVIRNTGFERFAVAHPAQVDAVIGNPPFGPRGGMIHVDPAKRELSGDEYGIDTGLDKLKSGGVLAMVVPHGVMDNDGQEFRRRMLGKAEFLGAYRLPTKAFTQAGATVVTDVIFLRKREQAVANMAMLLDEDEQQAAGLWHKDVIEGRYFEDGARVLGKQVEGFMGHAHVEGDLDEAALTKLAETPLGDPRSPSINVETLLAALPPERREQLELVRDEVPYLLPEGSVRTMGGIQYVLRKAGEEYLWRRTDDAAEMADIGVTEREALTRAADIGQRIEDLLAAIRTSDDVRALDFERLRLRGDVVSWVQEHGNPRRHTKLLGLISDKRVGLAFQAAVTPEGDTSALLRQEIAAPAAPDTGDAATIKEAAVRISRLEDGVADVAAIAQASGVGDTDAVKRWLVTPESPYFLEADGTWVDEPRYCSGDLYTKRSALERELTLVQEAGKATNVKEWAQDASSRAKTPQERERIGRTLLAAETLPQLQEKLERQMEVLSSRMTAVPLDDVDIELRSAWVPIEVLNDYCRSIDSDYGMAFDGVTYTPTLRGSPAPKYLDGAIKDWGAKKIRFKAIWKHLNRKTLAGSHEMQGAYRVAERGYKAWILGSKYRDAIEELYNRKFQSSTRRLYSTDPVELAGWDHGVWGPEDEKGKKKHLSGGYSPHGFQNQAIRMGLDLDRGIFADDTGLGKAQPYGSLVLSPSGWRRMGDLVVGDAVVDPDGGSCVVEAVYERGVRPCFEVYTEDGRAARCCDEHLWLLVSADGTERILPLFAVRNPREFSVPCLVDGALQNVRVAGVTAVGQEKMRCIRVSSRRSLYVTDGHMVTHNTTEIIGLVAAKRAAGTVRKSVIVVPKAVLWNWKRSQEKLCPGTKVLLIGEKEAVNRKGETITKADTKEERAAKWHRVAQEDFDLTVCSMESFQMLDVNPAARLEQLLREFEDANPPPDDERRMAAWEKKRETYRLKKEQELSKPSEAGAPWLEDIGIDFLCFDEAHAYKNLFRPKSRGGRVKYLVGTQGIARSTDLQYKLKRYKETNGGKGLFMATATPVKNSPLEVYTMLQYVAEDALRDRGILTHEHFIDRYVQIETRTGPNQRGQMLTMPQVVGFKNLNELRRIADEMVLIRDANMVGLPIPRSNKQPHMLEMTDQQRLLYDHLRSDMQTMTAQRVKVLEEQVEEAKEQGGEEGDEDIQELMAKIADEKNIKPDHAFKIMHLMNMVATAPGHCQDLFAHYGIEITDTRSPKLEAAAAAIAESYFANPDNAQLAFSDINFVHDDVRDRLIALGVPAEAIAVLNRSKVKSSGEQQAMADRFNTSGDPLRIIVGNTRCAGEGVDLQKRSTDIHHIDVPWDPGTLQQRNGRVIRQGNPAEEVREHYYLTKGTIDAYRQGQLAGKGSWLNHLWHGTSDTIEIPKESQGFSQADLLIAGAADPEEAAAQIEADRQAEIGRQAEKRCQEMTDQFLSLTRRHQAVLKERSKPKPDKLKLEAAESRVESLLAMLRESKDFPDKDALDHYQDARIVGTMILYPGRVLQTGKGSYLAVVRMIPEDEDHDAGAVLRRVAGPASYDYPEGRDVTVVDYALRGMRPTEYSAADTERIRVASTADRIRTPSSTHPYEVLAESGLTEEQREQYRPELEEAIRGRTPYGGGETGVFLRYPDGTVEVVGFDEISKFKVPPIVGTPQELDAVAKTAQAAYDRLLNGEELGGDEPGILAAAAQLNKIRGDRPMMAVAKANAATATEQGYVNVERAFRPYASAETLAAEYRAEVGRLWRGGELPWKELRAKVSDDAAQKILTDAILSKLTVADEARKDPLYAMVEQAAVQQRAAQAVIQRYEEIPDYVTDSMPVLQAQVAEHGVVDVYGIRWNESSQEFGATARVGGVSGYRVTFPASALVTTMSDLDVQEAEARATIAERSAKAEEGRLAEIRRVETQRARIRQVALGTPPPAEGAPAPVYEGEHEQTAQERYAEHAINTERDVPEASVYENTSSYGRFCTLKIVGGRMVELEQQLQRDGWKYNARYSNWMKPFKWSFQESKAYADQIVNDLAEAARIVTELRKSRRSLPAWRTAGEVGDLLKAIVRQGGAAILIPARRQEVRV